MPKHTLHLSLLLPLAALVLLAAACGPTTLVAVPSGYVQLEDDQLPYGVGQKVISPDGASIILRERDNEPEGSLAFWADALEREIVEGRGYQLIEPASDVTTSGGFKGRLMHFKAAYQGTTFFYDVAIFVVGDEIVTIEGAVTEANQATHKENLDAAFRSLRFN